MVILYDQKTKRHSAYVKELRCMISSNKPLKEFKLWVDEQIERRTDKAFMAALGKKINRRVVID